MTVERFFIREAKKANDIEEFLKKELDVAGFSHSEMKKTPLGTRIIIHALRPGLIIGARGESIKKLTVRLGEKFGLENPHLEVEQVREAFLDPHIVAWRLARSVEKGAYFKRSANITVNRIMQSGAKGVEIRLSGKLPSARSKTWKFIAGKLRKCGQDAIDQVQVAYAKAMTKPGIVGVRVAILPPDATFSDEIIRKYPDKPSTVKEEPKVEVVEIVEEVESTKAPEAVAETEVVVKKESEEVKKKEAEAPKEVALTPAAPKEAESPKEATSPKEAKSPKEAAPKKESTPKKKAKAAEKKPVKKEAKTSPQKD